MSEERLPCRTEGCDRTIQPATAKRNEGYCGPCRAQIDHIKRRAYIEKNRRDVDPYERITDPVDMITVFHRRRKYDPLINELPCAKSAEELYDSLTAEDADRLQGLVAEKVVGPESNSAEDIARCLAAFTDHNLDPLRRAYLKQDCLPPSIAFRGADDAFADALIDRMDGGRRVINETLLCLAWIGSPRVVTFFAHTQKELPDWAGSLYVHPSQYTQDAGWEVRDGQRHNLFYEDCLAITHVSESDPAAETSSLMQPRAEQCQWCDRTLVDMLRLSADDSRFAFLHEISDTIRVPMCDVCTCFSAPGPIFCQDDAGIWRWKPSNKQPDYLPDPDEDWGTQPWAAAKLRFKSRPAHFGADQFLPTTFSQIGGLPAWVQDADYPTCQDCGQTMTFIAQLDNADFDLCEGTYYAFHCKACRNSTTMYQQT